MSKSSNRQEPSAPEDDVVRKADLLRSDRPEVVPPSLVDPLVVYGGPVPASEPETPPPRALVDELPRRDVEELNRALDQATGVADTVVVTVKLSPREYRNLRDYAEASGQTEQMVLRDALFEYLERRSR